MRDLRAKGATSSRGALKPIRSTPGPGSI